MEIGKQSSCSDARPGERERRSRVRGNSNPLDPVAVSQHANQLRLAAKEQARPRKKHLSTALAPKRLGRIHDDSRNAYLKKIIKRLEGYKSMAEHADRFKAIDKSHKLLLKRSRKLRDNVFAHTSDIRRLVIAFGFDGITWNLFSSYWQDIASAAEALERNLFGCSYGPMFDAHQLQDDMDKANTFLDAISTSR
jgi:hypothetical protein